MHDWLVQLAFDLCAAPQTPKLATLYSHRREDTGPCGQAPVSQDVDDDEDAASSAVPAHDYVPASEGVLVVSDLVGGAFNAAHVPFRGDDVQHLRAEEVAVQRLSCGQQHMQTTTEYVMSEYERRLAGAHLFFCLGFRV